MCSYSGASSHVELRPFMNESEMRLPRSPRMRVLDILPCSSSDVPESAADAVSEALSGPMQLLKVSDDLLPVPAADSVALDDSLLCESPKLCGKRTADCFNSDQQDCKRRPSVEMRRDMPVEPALGAQGGGADASELPQSSITCPDVSAPGATLHRGISTVSVMAEGPMDEYRFNMFMNDLLSERRNDIVGFKGILCVQGCGDTRFAIRGSRRAIRYGPSGQPWHPEEPRISRMVFIGRGLDQEDLAAGFRTCVAAMPALAEAAVKR